MRVEDRVLAYFLAHPQTSTSGQALANRLEVSRNAVWKAIQSLKDQGYQIESEPGKGYRLKEVKREIDPVQIKVQLPTDWADLKLHYHSTVDSTNNMAKQLAVNPAELPALIMSSHQSQGRGRYGRSFYSAVDQGLYFSLAIQPMTKDLSELPLYTIATATAMVQACQEVFDKTLDVKWVNDLFYQGKKVVGILSEVINDLESGGISAVVIGVGMNLKGDFSQADPQVKEVAGTLFEADEELLNLNDFVLAFLKYFNAYYQNLSAKVFLPIYKDRLLGLNQRVSYHYNNESHQGIIRGIDSNGYLQVEQADGRIETLMGQDIHLSSQQFSQSNNSN